MAPELTHAELQLARAELAVVLSSSQLRRAPSLRKILRHVCEKYFLGDFDSIREYSIATQALGRPEDFNPGEDSIVRVEASKLRKRLWRYYQTEGATHRVQIHLPDIGYVPSFVIDNQSLATTRTGTLATASQSGFWRPEDPGDPLAESPALHVTPSFMRRLLHGKSLVALSLLAGVIVVFHIATRALRMEPAEAVTSPAGIGDQYLSRAAGAVRISAGMMAPRVFDSLGREWLGDRHFTGGAPIDRPEVRVLRTADPSIYRTGRRGEFRYDIPLQPGIYELHLHFCETQEGHGTANLDGTGRRRFDVFLNQRPLLVDFDVVVDAAGSGVADERVFTDVEPAADGLLHLEFKPSLREALLAGIEIIPGRPGKMHPLRILAGGATHYDSLGRLWAADNYYRGGEVTTRWTVAAGSGEHELYTTNRWGNFTYAIPVADGKYTVTLIFAEGHFRGGQIGHRLFDVYCNGRTLIESFDILKEAGGPNIIVEKTFPGLTANHQGKLLLSFVPERNYATLRAIEVVPE